MEFYRSLQSECLKLKGSRIPLITLFGGLMLSMIFTLRFILINNHINLSSNEAIWENLFSSNSRAFLGFIIPIGAMLICALMTQVEYGNNNWKQVHTTPQRLSTIFLTKFTVVIALTVIVFFILNLGITLHGVIPCLILDGRMPKRPIPIDFFFFETLKCFVLTLPIMAFQFLLSLHFRSFMVAIGIGLIVYVGSMPGIKLGAISNLSPYSFVLQYFDQVTTISHLWMSLIYFGVLILLSFILYYYKVAKG
ncbi:MAG: hypothetical protein ACJA1H_002299 [Glaciecola sp.]|jgi:hypothetical protein